MNGLLIVDKPSAMTSHDVVSRLRRATGESTIGHLGTLDPLATGVLPVLLGKYSRLAQFFGPLPKTYSGTIRFGFATDTYDADGIPAAPAGAHLPSNEELQLAAGRFRGRIEQTPPPFSAKKVDGKIAYKAARRGETLVLKPVSLLIEEFVVGRIEGGYAEFSIRISSGGYVRSVAHDLGKVLGCGAHLARLRRVAVGPFTLDQALALDVLCAQAADGTLEQSLPHPRTLLPELPATTADLWVAGRLEERQCGESARVFERAAGQSLCRPARSGCHCAPRGRHSVPTHCGSGLMLRFSEQGNDQRQQISRHLRVALVSRMDAVGLHSAGNAINAFKEKRQQRQVIFCRQQGIGLIELPDVVGTIVWWQGDAAQHYLSSGIEQRAHDTIEIVTGARYGQSAQSVVSTEGDDHQDRLQTQYVLEPINSVFGGVSANSLIDYLVAIALRVEILLQEVGIAVARICAKSCGKTVAESDDHRPAIRRGSGYVGGSRACLRSGCFWGFSRFRSTTGKHDAGQQETGKQRAQRGEVGHKFTVHPSNCVTATTGVPLRGPATFGNPPGPQR